MKYMIVSLGLAVFGLAACGDDGGSAADAAPSIDARVVDAGAPDAAPECGDGVVEGDEVCEPGLSACCASDCQGVLPSTQECRAGVDQCDPAERCDGTTPECPEDAFSIATTECTAGDVGCTVTGECDGLGSCEASLTASNGTTCDSCVGSSCQCLGATCVDIDTNCDGIKKSDLTAPDGTYWIDGDGAEAGVPFQVYCNMSTDGGGWTLVDNDAVTGEIFATREAGANADFAVTRGSLLPSYTWSDTPRVLCISDVNNGNEDWVTLAPTNSEAMSYPTSATGTSHGDTWAAVELNGNTNQGLNSYTFDTTFGNFGAFWVGNSASPTCACNYSTGGWTSIGAVDIQGSLATCSTWVR